MPPFWMDRLPAVMTLVRGKCGVALDDRDAREWDVKLFGRHLRQRRLYAGSEVDFARINRDSPLRVDGEIGINLRYSEETLLRSSTLSESLIQQS